MGKIKYRPKSDRWQFELNCTNLIFVKRLRWAFENSLRTPLRTRPIIDCNVKKVQVILNRTRSVVRDSKKTRKSMSSPLRAARSG